jgi:hypothetical protein
MAFRSLSSRCLALLIALHLVLYGGLLIWSGGVPYVFDNNESFSSLIHAHNLYQFPLSDSMGLTDEAYGQAPEAHPFVYTHQGNFPRAFALVIYAAGARTIESQIIVTTLTVGSLAIFLIFRFFSLTTGPWFGLVATSVLMTDYLYFVQWHLNTFRIWHSVFLFGALLCVRALCLRPTTLQRAGTFLVFACLTYFEIAFALFVCATSWAYALFHCRRRWRDLLVAWFVPALGALAGACFLIAQIVAYMGWPAFLEDLSLTYSARNTAATGPEYLERLRDFFDGHNLVFWYNLSDSSAERSVDGVVRALVTTHLPTYTPILMLVVLIVVCGIGLRWVMSRVTTGDHRRTTRSNLVPDVPTGTGRALLLWLCWYRVLAALARWDPLFAATTNPGLADPPTGLLLGFLLLVCAVGLSMSQVRLATGEWLGAGKLSVVQMAAAAALLLGVELVIETGWPMAESRYAGLWTVLWPGALRHRWLVSLVVAVTAFVSTTAIVDRRQPPPAVTEVWPFLVSTLFGYAVAFLVFPGYVLSGYLVRQVPFVSFTIATLVSVAIYATAKMAVTGSGSPCAWHWRTISAWARGGRGLNIGAAVAMIVVSTAWIHTQAVYMRQMPPDQAGYIQALRKPEYQGASFLVNNYAGPIAAMTGQWAYMGRPTGETGLRLTPSGYSMNSDAWANMWLADKRSNPDYHEPNYFLCTSNLVLTTVAAEVAQNRVYPRCTDEHLRLRREMEADPTGILAFTIVDRDPSVRDRWMIVKLEWDFPPYLLADPVLALDRRRRDESEAAGLRLQIDYDYTQQQGKEEHDSLFRVYTLADGSSCEPGDSERDLLLEATLGTPLSLPAGFQGHVVASVVPTSDTQSGEEYFTDVMRITNSGLVRCS